MNSPLVSIVIPLYNREELVKETLNSILAQTYLHWECIIVDDVSTDNSLASAKEYGERDSRFKVIKRHREPKGAPTCRNIGLEKAEGELVVFFDSDDLMMPYCLENRVKYFLDDEGLELLISYQKRMEKGEELSYVNVPSDVHPLIRFYTLHPNWDIPWVSNSTTIKKSFLLQNEIFWNETIEVYQDIQFHIHVISAKPNFIWNDSPFDSLWLLHKNEKSIGNSNYKEFETEKNLMATYWGNLKSSKLDIQLKNQLWQQWQHIVVVYLKRNVVHSNPFIVSTYRFVCEIGGFNKLTIYLIKLLASIERRKIRLYIHRLIRRKIHAHFEKKFPPVIIKGTFLKHNRLSI